MLTSIQPVSKPRKRSDLIFSGYPITPISIHVGEMAMSTVYTVKQAADALQTSTATVRRTADAFSDHLPDYQVVSGEARLFTDADVRTLYALLSRLNESPGLTRSALLSELSTPDSEPLIIPAILPTAKSQEARIAPENALAIPEATTAAESIPSAFLVAIESRLAPLESINDRLSALDRLSDRLQALESRKATKNLAVQVGLYLAVGVLFVGVAWVALTGNTFAAVVAALVALAVLVAASVWGRR